MEPKAAVESKAAVEPVAKDQPEAKDQPAAESKAAVEPNCDVQPARRSRQPGGSTAQRPAAKVHRYPHTLIHMHIIEYIICNCNHAYNRIYYLQL